MKHERKHIIAHNQKMSDIYSIQRFALSNRLLQQARQACWFSQFPVGYIYIGQISGHYSFHDNDIGARYRRDIVSDISPISVRYRLGYKVYNHVFVRYRSADKTITIRYRVIVGCPISVRYISIGQRYRSYIGSISGLPAGKSTKQF